jgi:hypothetical protein
MSHGYPERYVLIDTGASGGRERGAVCERVGDESRESNARGAYFHGSYPGTTVTAHRASLWIVAAYLHHYSLFEHLDFMTRRKGAHRTYVWSSACTSKLKSPTADPTQPPTNLTQMHRENSNRLTRAESTGDGRGSVNANAPGAFYCR